MWPRRQFLHYLLHVPALTQTANIPININNNQATLTRGFNWLVKEAARSVHCAAR